MLIQHFMRVLDYPIVYSFVMKLLGSCDSRPLFINDNIKPNSGDKILDVGCGPADILKYLPNNIQYVGIDFNEMYIETAKRQYGDRASFILGNVNNLPKEFKNFFDIILIIGVIHHLPDNEAKNLNENGYNLLKEEGRLITLDNIDGDCIGIINKLALKMDRGEFIRNIASYLNLFTKFPNVKTP